MEINKNLSNEIEIENTIIAEKQNNFLQSNLGKVINGAVDIGIKAVLPDYLENEIIEIKDSFISEGFEAGINKVVTNAIDLGKNIVGIFNGNFSDISQAENAVKNGGLIDGISNVLDFALDKIKENNILSEDLVDVIKDGKNILLNNIENRIREDFKLQISTQNNIEKNISHWKQSFVDKNISKMDELYEKIQDEIGNVMPTENLLKSAKEIENLQTLIKNNNGDFDFTKEQIELSKMLV